MCSLARLCSCKFEYNIMAVRVELYIHWSECNAVCKQNVQGFSSVICAARLIGWASSGLLTSLSTGTSHCHRLCPGEQCLCSLLALL